MNWRELGKWNRAVVMVMVPDGDRGVVKGGDAAKERPRAVVVEHWVKKERLGSGKSPCTVVG